MKQLIINKIGMVIITIVVITIIIILGILGYRGYKYIKNQYTIPPVLDSLEKRVVMCGDVEAYNDIIFYYPKVGLIYAFIMAHKYDYLPACEDIYHMLITSSVDSLYIPDEKTKRLAIEYLIYAAEKKDIDACLLLSEEYMYGININKDTVAGLRYYFYYCHSDSILYEKSLPFYRKMIYDENGANDIFGENIKVTLPKFRNNPYYIQ